MLEQLRKLVGEDHVWVKEPMKYHTTFRAGGCADYLVEPESVDAVREIVRLCRQENVPYYVVGNGSNLLVSDEGYHGVILHLYKNMSELLEERELNGWKLQKFEISDEPTLSKLREEAKTLKIKGYTKMTKEELESAIKESEDKKIG